MSQQRLPGSVDSDRPTTKRQRAMVDLILTTGMSVKDAAAQLGTADTNVYRDLRKPHVKKYMQQRTLDHIGILAPYAANCQSELLHSDSDHVRANVAENILNRHLGKPVERKQISFQGVINVSIDLS